ncbi:hypothetical protein C84B14_07445 [Salinisphaera sp. C84B14]|uniref:hypothetical protein n=1 Tax=Salinisphaera sp. C84B14 TaxID=1304155 RepID=UPI0033405712
MKSRSIRTGFVLFSLLLAVAPGAGAADYGWNYPAPIKTPSAAADNGKTVLFDVSHGGTQGNADWVLDGAFSDFADALVARGYTVGEYRGVDKNDNGIIDFVDDYSDPSQSATDANEAVITYAGIRQASVLVLAESNRPFTRAEQDALERFLAEGGGLYFIADHYNADRNLNTWDATEVFNGYNRSDRTVYNKGGAYGDLRNPGTADAGWLAETFGVRYRFNGIDWKSGVSGIEDPASVEGLTDRVAPILMAGGATLAIVDPNRAKGLVYFSPSDSPEKWGPAVDRGVYFGGRAEGPYVAIAKAGAGKAAFIGDSSPIEDDTPRYRREENGGDKSTYPGWTDSGNAARLSTQIVDWLATPESYTQFASAAHPAGEATPTPMADVEKSDPDNGAPWRQPDSGYDPFDPATFANGAYGAPQPVGGATSSPDAGTGDDVSVSQALAANEGTTLTAIGRITRAVNDQYALELADLNDDSATIYVKLEAGDRERFSPENDPSLVGKTLRVTGTRDTYIDGPSLESTRDLEIVDASAGNDAGDCGDDNGVSVATARAASNGTSLDVVGRVIEGVNDPYALRLGDLAASATIVVKLESGQRGMYSPANNPGIVDETVSVRGGMRDEYAGEASIESVDSLAIVQCDG